MSGYNVIWSPTARITYFQVLDYLEEEWTIKEIKSFIHRTGQVIKYIEDNPLLYPYSAKGNVHKCVVVKQVSLFYQVKANEIEILVFWDNRQDPAKLIL